MSFTRCLTKMSVLPFTQMSRRHLLTTSRQCYPLPPDIEKKIKFEDFQVIKNLESAEATEPLYLNIEAEYVCLKASSISMMAIMKLPKVPAGETWSVGFIQACNYYFIENYYGDDGKACWEIPRLKSGANEMVNDSSGLNYPWYDHLTSVTTIKGPRKPHVAGVTMTDKIHTMAKWFNPLDDMEPRPWWRRLITWFSRLVSPDVKLSKMVRNQGFYTWLVIRCDKTGEIRILKTVKWEVHSALDVDWETENEEDAVLRRPWESKDKYTILPKNNVPIPKNVLGPPRVNSAQSYSWYPSDRNKIPIVIIPATDQSKA